MTKLTAELLLRGYSMGVFPMAENRDSPQIQWIDPHDRGVIPLDGLHISRSLRKTLLRTDYQVRLNTDFMATVQACANRDETWINAGLLDAYCDLHARGYAHSLEIWQEDEMVGGVYGVSLGAAFFGESMFSQRRDGSKIALAWLAARLRYGGFTLLDTQFLTDHLQSMGAIEIPRAHYQDRLRHALMSVARIDALPLDVPAKTLFSGAGKGP